MIAPETLPILMIALLAVLLFSGYPVALVLAGVGLTFGFIGYAFDFFPLIAYMNVPLRIYGNIGENLLYPAVPMLLFMGVTLEKSGIARELLTCLQLLLRRVPGSLAIAVTLMGIILAPSAGLIGASVAMLALVALPTMLAQGYKPSFATGSVAAAGTLGIIFPPAIMLFFLAELLETQIAFMFLGILVPAFSLGALYIAYYVVRCGLNPELAPRPETVPPASALLYAIFVIRGLALPVLLIAMVLGSIITGWATPTQSGSVGAAGALLLTFLNRSFSFRLLHQVIMRTALMTAMVFFVVIGATVFSYTFRYFGGDDVILGFLNSLGLEDWGILIFVLSIIFVLGFFIDWIEITLVTLPIFLPILKVLDFSNHLGSPEFALGWIGVLIAINLQSSFLTPPFGFALFFLKGSAPPGVNMGDIYRGIVPFVVIQLFGLGMVMAFPDIAMWLPLRILE